MTRGKVLHFCCQKAIEYEALGYVYWKSKSADFPLSESFICENETINIELCILEARQNYIHISLLGDDNSFLMTRWPVGTSFIVRDNAI